MLEAYDLEGIDPDDAPSEGDQVVSWIFTGLGDLLEDYIETVSIFLSGELESYFLAFCTLFIAVYGYCIIYGWIESSQKQITKDLAKFVFIMLLFFSWTDEFLPLLIELAFDEPAELTAGIIEAVTDDIDAMQDDNAISILDKVALSGLVYLGTAIDAWEFLSPSTWMGVIEAIALVLCIFYMLIYTVFLLLKSFLIITLFLSVGQVFIPFLLFSATRGVGLAWWNQITTYMFVPFFALLLLSIVFAIGYHQYEALNAAVVAGDPVASSNLMGSIIISVIGGLTMREVPDLARAVGGGFSFSGGNGFANKTARAARSGAVGVWKTGGAAIDKYKNRGGKAEAG
jgi:type IV secretion system protein VirB6